MPALAYAAVLALRLRSGPAPAARIVEPQEATDATDSWRPFARLTLVVALRSVFFLGVSSFPALGVVERLRLEAGAGGAAVTALFVAGIAGTLVGGRLADRLAGSARCRRATC